VVGLGNLDELRYINSNGEAVIQRGCSDMGPMGSGLYTAGEQSVML
jgi:hypothetical protein